MDMPKLAAIEDDVKVITLLCYLFEYLGGLSESQLLEIVTTDGLITQFKLSDALATIEQKNLASLENGVYSINESGKQWLRDLENTLTITLRRKVLQDGKNVVHLAEFKKSVRWRVAEINKPDSDKVWVFQACFLNELDGSPLMEIKFYSKTQEGAMNAQEKFLKNPAKTLSDSIANFM
jgi:hypothetical protein